MLNIALTPDPLKKKSVSFTDASDPLSKGELLDVAERHRTDFQSKLCWNGVNARTAIEADY